MTILITGGAGFIGSHLADRFMEQGEDVRVFDNLSAGTKSNIEKWVGDPRFDFVKGDLLESSEIKAALEGCRVVYHLAANPEVRSWLARPEDHFNQNILGTYNLLEAIREQGASKLAAEALICSYSSLYGFRSVVYRMANVVGPRSGHGVIYDFAEKLKRNPDELEVLGDGTQSKSYLFIDDCITGMILGAVHAEATVEILNIGSEDRVSVLEIASIVIEEMGLKDVEVELTGGVDGGRGWKGDVKLMQLDMSRLRAFGWSPLFSSKEAVRLTAISLVKGR
jgi:UDP-glucose 4-epimerase